MTRPDTYGPLMVYLSTWLFVLAGVNFWVG